MCNLLIGSRGYFKSQYDDFKKRTLLSRVVNKVILKLLSV